MQVVDNKIIYANHVVVCDPVVASTDYMKMMAESLSENGTADDYYEELEHMNNDGSWSIIH